jgi:cytochrome c oxidase subunit 2
MSRNGLIVVVVIVVALIVSAYFSFGRGPENDEQSTPSASIATTVPSSDLATRGAVLFTQYRCNICHTIDGKRAAGPTLAGLYGSQVTLTTGQTIIANETYIRQSILDPDSQIVSGYGPSVMSAALSDFTAQLSQDETINALVAYVESLM